MGPLRLEVSESSTGRAVLVKLVGEFDMSDAGLFAQTVTHGVVQNGHSTVALECSDVSFIDSSGLRALIDAQEAAAARGSSLVLVAPSDAVQQVVDVTGLAGHFRIAADERGLDD